MNARTILLAALAGLVAATSAWGDETTASLRDVTVVQDGHGSARVFFRLSAIPFSERTALERAVLTIPYTGASDSATVELLVCPVTQAWSGVPAWDTPFDRRLRARAEVDLNSPGVASMDLTVPFMEHLEDGAFTDGFVLLARTDSGGLPARDLARFGNLSGARVYVRTTVLPSGWPPQGREATRRVRRAATEP